MSQQNSLETGDSTWIAVGRFSRISATKDGQREFLEAISQFIITKEEGLVPSEGLYIPNLGNVAVGNILDISYETDTPKVNDAVMDGTILVKRVNKN